MPTRRPSSSSGSRGRPALLAAVVILAAVFLTLLYYNNPGGAPRSGGSLVGVNRLLEEGEAHLAAARYAEAALRFQQAGTHAHRILSAPGGADDLTAEQRLAARRVGEAAFGEVAATLSGLEAAHRARSLDAAETGARYRLQPDEAEALRAVLDRGLAADSENAELHYLRGRVESAAGELRAAENAYETALRLDPDLAQAYNDLGLLYLREEFLARAPEPGVYRERARQNFEKALLASGDAGEKLPAAHFNLGLWYAGLAQSDVADVPRPEALSRARTHLRAFLRDAPADAPDRLRAERHLARILGEEAP